MKSPVSLPRPGDAKNDLIAGLNTLVIGTPIGGLFARSVLMPRSLLARNRSGRKSVTGQLT